MMRKTNQKGFTLVELLVVIAIIGLLATLAVVSLNNARAKARNAARKSDMNAIATAMELKNAEDSAYIDDGTPCATNVLADTAASNAICSGQKIQTTAGQVLLQSMPSDPGSNTYLGFSDTTSYCISATLESDPGGAAFKCVNGSCFYGAACTGVSG